jgi:hypothetical protein
MRAHESLSTHAVRVTDGDRTAVDVESIVGKPELVAAIKNLYREGFVEFPQSDIGELHARTLQQLRDRIHGTDTHLVGFASRHGESAEDAERL